MKLADGTEWVLVPKVATEEMLATCAWREEYAPSLDDWSAMLAAAPQPPVEELVAMIAQEIEENAFEPPIATARAIVKRLMGDSE